MVVLKKFYIFLALAFLLSSCANNEFKALNGDENLEFLYDGFQKTLKIKDQNQPYALFFLTSDCGVCKAQIPILNELYKTRKFKIIAVLNGVKDKNEAQQNILEKNILFPLLYQAKASLFLSKAVGDIYGVPVIVFVDENGILKEKFIGLTPKNILENQIKLLKQYDD
ncbi:TlpA family protein disulfide reductase [Campylobacter insulaenigrae]|uniref:TlpA family protein disulfide reductase n=1 Tax=Campylobacter insulaenigrae TaxID=260714 RepID=UPI002152C80A|nr:TlpA disulfide reductase family protein [Campylobacter insulaenigrae]MCR6572746.1 TlpA family protein disulfide reductase [Campylobacter insulaenigrae]MCR6575616.1 TlpA family protein disulfide reductase [Campylobacter insulaenigrae]MCR6581657.1 TlpA family protein disulfide reductase [Campylobacter insulaenigrae]MCR6587841.1 TlpA family protein disulfide reductase [Campylobacter insulaenigrae]